MVTWEDIPTSCRLLDTLQSEHVPPYPRPQHPGYAERSGEPDSYISLSLLLGKTSKPVSWLPWLNYLSLTPDLCSRLRGLQEGLNYFVFICFVLQKLVRSSSISSSS